MERKEAIEVIKKNWPDSSFTMLREALETLVPELKESEDEKKPNGGIVLEDFNEGEGFYKVNLAYLNKEQVEEIEGLVKKWNTEPAETEDERIRKEIILFLREGKPYHCPNSAKRQEWSNWLEKQGKKAKYHDICDKCVRQPTCQSDCFLQQSEQKPTDKVEPKFKIGQIIKKEGFNTGFTIASIINGFYYNDEGDYFPFTDQDNWELVEQKSAWSEEDEGCLENAIMYCEWARDKAPDVHCYETSEKSINWLKSLRPQNTWKPSDEQMKQLHKYCPDNRPLTLLYNDLKKLK